MDTDFDTGLRWDGWLKRGLIWDFWVVPVCVHLFNIFSLLSLICFFCWASTICVVLAIPELTCQVPLFDQGMVGMI